MKRTFRVSRILAGAALLSAVALPGTALAATAHPAATHPSAHPATRPAKPAWALPRCKEGQTEIWLGLGNGGGTAGTIFYPLEFTNISKHACDLWGYPKTWALGAGGHHIGKSSRHLAMKHGIVSLWPGWTAHASLGIVEAGNVCASPVTAAGLQVRAPHQGSSTQLGFSFQACRHKRVLVTGPIMPGVGIP